MILGQIIKGLNNEWDKQIEFREEERRIAEERGFRVEQDEKSWDRQLANQKLGWDREDSLRRDKQAQESEELLTAYGMLPGFSKFKPAQIASIAKAGKVGYETLNTTINNYLKAGGTDVESLINYNYMNTGGTADSLASDINSTSRLFNQKVLTDAFKKNSEKPNSVDLNISAAAANLFKLKNNPKADPVAIDNAQKKLDQWTELKKTMANLKPTDAPTTLTKTNLQNTFDIGKGNAFNQMSIQFDVQESKAIRKKKPEDIGKVDQFDSLAEYVAAENMKEYFGDFTNVNDKKRADSYIRAAQKNALGGMEMYAQQQFGIYRTQQSDAGINTLDGLKAHSSVGGLYQHFTSGEDYLTYLKSGKQKVGTIASVFQDGKVSLFIITPFKYPNDYLNLGEYDPNAYAEIKE